MFEEGIDEVHVPLRNRGPKPNLYREVIHITLNLSLNLNAIFYFNESNIRVYPINTY